MAGFYSDNFGKQGGNDEQIQEQTVKHGVKHDQYVVAPVVGDGQRAVFQWILSQPNPGPRDALEMPWNFFKYLISPKGELLGAFEIGSYPGRDPSAAKWAESDLVQAIEKNLG